MKNKILAVACLLTVVSTTYSAGGETPDGLSKSDWASIREAYEAGKHLVHRQVQVFADVVRIMVELSFDLDDFLLSYLGKVGDNFEQPSQRS